MNTLNNNKTGLAMGGLLALAHLGWSLLVMFGWAGWWINFVLGLHFLNNPFVISPFSAVTALGLIVVTGIVGYAVGWVFATMWNMMEKHQ